MPEPDNINESGLDELLRELYLEENSEKANEKDAGFVLQSEYPVHVDRKKEKQLLTRLNKNAGNTGSLKLWIIVLSVILIGLIMWLVLKGKNTAPSKAEHTAGETSLKDKIPNAINRKEKTPTQRESDQNVSAEVPDTFGKPDVKTYRLHDSISLPDKTEASKAAENNEKSIPYILPKDVQRYEKIKEQMIRKLIGKDKGLYTFIPAGKTEYSGKEITLDAFTIRNVGITNLEYRAFLADLLAKKRNDDYLVASVNTHNWNESAYPVLAADYFENEKYNDFPVVNITQRSALLFCKWLQEETQLYINRNKLKQKELNIRLPYDDEWIYAAREGYAKIAFEPGYNTIYDDSEGLVGASFRRRAELIKRRVKRVDTLYTQFTTNHYNWTEKELIAFFNQASRYYNAVAADTIYPDRMKVSGKIGRVSEMVMQRSSPKLWLSGLSWKSKEDYKQLENDFISNGSSPFVGFRIVIVDPKDPEYKNPFW